MGKEISPGGWHQLIDDELERIDPELTEFMCSAKLLSIGEGSVSAEKLKEKKTVTSPADFVVLSMGVKPVNALAKQLEGKVQVCTAGDAVGSGTIADACHSAYEQVMKIK